MISPLAKPPSSPIRSNRLVTILQHLRLAWNQSLRFRLLALGLMPLLLAFPVVIGALLLVGGEGTRNLLESNMRGNLASARSYLNQVKTEAGVRVDQLVKSERLINLMTDPGKGQELMQSLATSAKGSGLDFLVVATQDGTVLGSSTGVQPGTRLPDSHVIQQARIGVANAGFERYEAGQLDAFSPKFREEAAVQLAAKENPGVEGRALLINAAAHFPLTVDHPDAILVGGILLNKNASLIDHLREIIYPLGALPGNVEGLNALYLDDVMVAVSRQRLPGPWTAGMRADRVVAHAVLERGVPWIGNQPYGEQSYFVGYEAIFDAEGDDMIGMVAAGFPDAPYRKVARNLVGVVILLMALTMLVISVLFLRTGREFTQRLAGISDTMIAVGVGNRAARVGTPLREDELGRLSRDFNGLLDLITHQDEMRRVVLQNIADEASRRRALFEHERDGVVILNPDGSVFEANPKCLEMLGYGADEVAQLALRDWEAQLTPGEMERLLAGVGPEGTLFETVHRRKDGTTYAAEVSISRVEWGDRTFVLALQRDITERKQTEAELEKHRHGLEELVGQRTKELHDRSEQLNAIFALSPDGFVSFDRDFRVSFANAAFLRMTGMEAGEVVGLDETVFSERLGRRCLPQAVFPGVARLRVAREKVGADGTAASEDRKSRRQTFELQPPLARVLEVGIRLAEAESVSQILYFRDITHESEVDRMKSEFLSTAAHELRTPMASIYGYTELLMTQDFDEDMRKEILGTIYSQSELISSIVNELLDLARIEARQGKDFVIERVSVAEIVDSAKAAYKPPQGRDPPLFDACRVPQYINADRKKIQQALLNILSNAYKYSPQGGEVNIACRHDEGQAGLRAGIEVRDLGIGMTPDQLAHVFERFYRADTSGKIPGTGLGMSIVKEITELHGGSVEVASTLGTGTTVTLWIPVA